MIPPRKELMFLGNKLWNVTIPTLAESLDPCRRESGFPLPVTAAYTLEQLAALDQQLLHLTLQEAVRALFPLVDRRCTSACKSSFLEDLSLFVLRLRLKSRDLYSHSLHVLHITCIFTEMLHLPAELSAGIKIAALFHDIGKIHISDELLQKPSHLTWPEFEEMKKHCAHGASMLLHIKQLREVVPMVFHHHERWDGRGYPTGLQGRAIPLGARIIATADAFAAMTSERAYRTPISPAQALAELSRCAGSQFDPLLVEHFCIGLAAVGLD
jgi:putative nucleotidyltransferase with HDIG domain